MKTRFKIAVIVMMGMSGLLNAQEGVVTGSNGKSDFIYHNGNVGIGIDTPLGKLDANGGAFFRAPVSGGVASNIATVDGINSMTFRAYDDRGEIHLQNERDFVLKDTRGRVLIQGNHGGSVGIGMATTLGHKLAVGGSIGAREIKVESGRWSDFVFEKNYNLPTLKEVENHIKEKGHLKDIPSAKEVEKNGFYLGEMDAKLLQKIEELTLYTIQQDKEIKNLKDENKLLKSLNLKLLEVQKRLDKLENKK